MATAKTQFDIQADFATDKCSLPGFIAEVTDGLAVLVLVGGYAGIYNITLRRGPDQWHGSGGTVTMSIDHGFSEGVWIEGIEGEPYMSKFTIKKV
jgi:hypothetical protein